MGWYDELHGVAEDWIVAKLKLMDHAVQKELGRDREVIFDVFDSSTNTAYEVLTAKIIRSAHEQDEAIIAKAFRYLLEVPRLRFYLASYDHEEMEIFHKLGMEHWHLDADWNARITKSHYHRGKPAHTVIRRIFDAMRAYAPIKEWIRPKRRKAHTPFPHELEELNARLGLPKNFLKGIWRDWRLAWVLRLEKVLPAWERRYGR